jgi:hypothetical protein
MHSGLQHSGEYYFIRGTESRNLQLDPPRQGAYNISQLRISHLNPSILSEVKCDIPYVSMHMPKGKSELVVELVWNSRIR